MLKLIFKKEYLQNKLKSRLIFVFVCVITSNLWFSNLTARDDIGKIELSPASQEALNHGVTLTFDCHLAVVKPFLFFNFEHNKKDHHFTVTRHALSNSFMVRKDNIERPHMFRSLVEAIDYIKSESLILLGSYKKTNKLGQMRITLNRYELPGPMRLQAFISGDWDVDTGWMTWEFET